MAHLVLLGDSIFDNKAYVGAEPDVVSHLRAMMPDDWQATLAAVDGSVAEGVVRQAAKIPAGATHLFVSAGGNDALMNADLLTLPAHSSAAVFDQLADRVSDFEARYRAMLEALRRLDLPITVCTVYFPNFADAAMQKITTAALAAFNDAIVRQAIVAGLPVIDLRLVCDEKSDYANEIEPSGAGGRKIAAKILETAGRHDFSRRQTVVYA